MAIDEKSGYYDAGGIESIKVIQAKSTVEQYYGYLHGNVLKYATRRNFKGCSIRDTEKIGVYNALLLDLEKAMQWIENFKIEYSKNVRKNPEEIKHLFSLKTALELLETFDYFNKKQVKA